MRFTSAVEVDEIGVETTVNKTVVESIYAPRVALSRQTGELGADGGPEVFPVSVDTSAELRVISILCETVQKRGDLILRREIEERGWFNPERARLRVSLSPFNLIELAHWGVDHVELELLPRLLGAAGAALVVLVRLQEAQHVLTAGIDFAIRRGDRATALNLLRRFACRRIPGRPWGSSALGGKSDSDSFPD